MRLWPYGILLILLGGALHSFIIALYAGMYGFPLTIYLLTSALPADIPLVHASGHLWATLLGFGHTGAVVEMMTGSVFVLIGLLLIIKGWVKIYFSDGTLVTDGAHGLIRHLQYAGIFVTVFGQLVHWPTVFTLALAPVIVWLLRLARYEEARLVKRLGDTYEDFRRRVPMLVPHLRGLSRMLSGGA
uniref:Isoprenylcysteine carboxyl methyltransferase n=1 Tax=Sinorhizobium sp. M14 TaxID=430451 RepID=A0A142BPP5_9HYPH|nr:Isoprenylcysteine carboxyl methyltransferase [Sinorhizobium sp. M14]